MIKTEKTSQLLEFTVERSETFVIRRQSEIVTKWCSGCGATARMLKPEDAARLTGVSTRSIYSGIEAGNAHSVELTGGELLICISSLEAA